MSETPLGTNTPQVEGHMHAEGNEEGEASSDRGEVGERGLEEALGAKPGSPRLWRKMGP